jgi:hypothetical protein
VSEPVADRPHAPGYGISEEAPDASWPAAASKLESAHNFWLATVGADGRPHVMPVWGLWLDGAFLFSTDPASRKGRNLAVNAEAVVHLESGDDVVILEGGVERPGDAELLRRFSDAYFDKYGIRLEPAPGFGIYALRPRRAFTWGEADFPQSATRWRWL